MNGTTITSSAVVGAVPAGWSLVGVGDVNGDGKDDLIFRSNTGVVAAWIMDGFSVRNVEVIGSMATNYQLAWVADFDGNGIKDFLWFDPATGSAIIWELFATAPINVWNLGTLGAGWKPALVGDFDGDGRADILWRNGATSVIWYMNAGVAKQTQLMPTVDAGRGDGRNRRRTRRHHLVEQRRERGALANEWHRSDAQCRRGRCAGHWLAGRGAALSDA